MQELRTTNVCIGHPEVGAQGASLCVAEKINAGDDRSRKQMNLLCSWIVCSS